jgi:hypothetical protein
MTSRHDFESANDRELFESAIAGGSSVTDSVVDGASVTKRRRAEHDDVLELARRRPCRRSGTRGYADAHVDSGQSHAMSKLAETSHLSLIGKPSLARILHHTNIEPYHNVTAVSLGSAGNETVGNEISGECRLISLRFPVELWLEILELLDRQALSGVALTCKPLYQLSTPILNKEWHLGLSPKAKWKAPDTATARRLSGIVISTDPPLARAPLRALFISLPRYVSLQSLTFRNVFLQPRQWRRLRQMLASRPASLSRLTSLTLIRCHLQHSGVDVIGFAVPHIHVEHTFNRPWPCLVSPPHLTHLTVPSMSAADAQRVPCLPHLRSLRILQNHTLILECSLFLSGGKCPNLESFDLEPCTNRRDSWMDVNPDLEFHLPNLRSYRGPHTYAPIFARSASLVHASLWCAGANTIEAELLRRLAEFAPALERLQASIFRPTAWILDAIGRFLALEELVMELRGWPSGVIFTQVSDGSD